MPANIFKLTFTIKTAQMKNPFQILVVSFVLLTIILCTRQNPALSRLAEKNCGGTRIQECANEIYGTVHMENRDSVRLPAAPIDLKSRRLEITYTGEEIRFYKNGLYMNSIY